MGQKIDMVGIHGEIEVLRFYGNDKTGRAMWECKCKCGKIFITSGKRIRNGDTKSCGCLKDETGRNQLSSHGMSSIRLYRLWKAIITRCCNPQFAKYNLYGGRGITVCDEWRNNFKAFYDWSMANGYKEDISESGRNRITLDRENTNGNYSPENCRWVSQTTQCRNQNTRADNKSGHKGVTYDRKSGMWRAGIGVNKKYIYLGSYKSIEQAICARENAEILYWRTDDE